MGDNRKISPFMQAAIDLAKEGGGKLVRLPGGFWTIPGEPLDLAKIGVPFRHVGTTTVQTLVQRGLATYTKMQSSKRRSMFPIEMTLTEKGPSNVTH